MVISLSVMDTGFKRYMRIEKGEHRDNTCDVIQLSIADHFENCYNSEIPCTLITSPKNPDHRSRHCNSVIQEITLQLKSDKVTAHPYNLDRLKE